MPATEMPASKTPEMVPSGTALPSTLPAQHGAQCATRPVWMVAAPSPCRLHSRPSQFQQLDPAPPVHSGQAGMGR